jgi:hypothetical protein
VSRAEPRREFTWEAAAAAASGPTAKDRRGRTAHLQFRRGVLLGHSPHPFRVQCPKPLRFPGRCPGLTSLAPAVRKHPAQTTTGGLACANSATNRAGAWVNDSCCLAHSPKGSGWLAQGNALRTRFADRLHAESARQIEGRSPWSACVPLLTNHFQRQVPLLSRFGSAVSVRAFLHFRRLRSVSIQKMLP